MTGTNPGTPNDPKSEPPFDGQGPDKLPQPGKDGGTPNLDLSKTPSNDLPLYLRPDDMWPALGVSDLAKAIGQSLPLETLAQRHLEEHPFAAYAERIQKDSMLWYEGSYDPIGVHHFKIFCDTIRLLGFQRATLAMVYEHPIKTLMPYKHRYEMARSVLETAGFKVVDNINEDGICLLPPGQDGFNRFHVARMEAMYNRKNFILIGPDNFERALETNILWTHIHGVKDSVSGRERYGFKRMYDGGIVGFKDRVIVYPEHNGVHSTNIRSGDAPMLGPVERYAQEHNLYSFSGTPPSSSSKTSSTASPRSTPITVCDGRTTEEEMQLRRELLTRVGMGFQWSFSDTREIYQAVLGSADRSELKELLNILTKCRTRAQNENANVEKYFFDKRAPLATELLSLMSETVIGNDIQIKGLDHVTKIHDMPGARIIFVANESGWGDIPVFTHALRVARLGNLAENLTLVFKRDVFDTPLLAGLVGHAATVIKPAPGVATASIEVQERVSRAALQGGLQQLNRGPVVLFPEDPASDRKLFQLAQVGPEVVEGLSTYIKTNEDPDVTPSEVFIVPVGMVGGSYLSAGSHNEPFSRDYPAVVTFGEAILLTSILDIASKHGNEVTGHAIGHRVADLLPIEWRGSYATGEATSDAQERARQIADQLISSQQA